MAGTIRAYVGRLGMGKSYNAVHDLIGALQKGRQVYSSFDVALGAGTPEKVIDRCGPGEWRERTHARTGQVERRFHPARLDRFEGWEQMLELEDAEVVIDEAHLYAPSWDPKAMAASVRWYLSHARKMGVNVTYVTQHEDRVARTLRDLANEVVVWQRYYLGAQWFLGKCYAPEDVRKKDKHTMRLVRRFRPWVGQSYDTLECTKFSGLVDPGEIALVDELARRRNNGVPLVGSVEAVKAALAAEAAGLEVAGDAGRRAGTTGRRSQHTPHSLL